LGSARSKLLSKLEIGQEFTTSRALWYHHGDIEHEDCRWFAGAEDSKEHDLDRITSGDNNELKKGFIRVWTKVFQPVYRHRNHRKGHSKIRIIINGAWKWNIQLLKIW